jgi:hypothetical protein
MLKRTYDYGLVPVDVAGILKMHVGASARSELSNSIDAVCRGSSRETGMRPGFQAVTAQSSMSRDGSEVRLMLARAVSRQSWFLPLVGLAAVVLCLPFLRTIFSMGDEGVLLHGAARMLRGDRLYADFFEFLPPGGFVLTEAWLRIVGISVLSARSLAIITIAGIACFTFLACRQASRNAPLSACLAICWVIMSQGVWTQLSHHWLTTMFSIVGVWAALANAGNGDRRWRWPLIAGAASGTASMITPTCGALAMLAALTAFFPLRRHCAALIAYVLAGASVPIGLVLYLAWRHALVAGFNDVIVFTASQYAPMQGLPYGYWASLQNAPFVYVFPLAAVLALTVYVRDRRASARDRMLWPCAAFGFAGFVASFPRPDVFHIAFEVPLACPLLAYCAIRLTEAWRPAYRAAAVGVVAGLLTPAVFAFGGAAQYVSRTEIVPTSRGGLAFFQLDGAPEMLARIAALPPGDGWFFYPFMPMMPFLSGRENVSKYDILTPGYSLPAQYQETCVSVMRRAAWVVIDRRWTDTGFLRQEFPALRDPRPPETRAFEQALDRGFDLVAQHGTLELRHRRDGVSDIICNDMAE